MLSITISGADARFPRSRERLSPFPVSFFFCRRLATLSRDEACARSLRATALMQSEKYAAHVGGEIMHFSFHRVQRAFESRVHPCARVSFSLGGI